MMYLILRRLQIIYYENYIPCCNILRVGVYRLILYYILFYFHHHFFISFYLLDPHEKCSLWQRCAGVVVPCRTNSVGARTPRAGLFRSPLTCMRIRLLYNFEQSTYGPRQTVRRWPDGLTGGLTVVHLGEVSQHLQISPYSWCRTGAAVPRWNIPNRKL